MSLENITTIDACLLGIGARRQNFWEGKFRGASVTEPFSSMFLNYIVALC